MKQYEYLRELRENLEGHMTPEEIDDILSDYESFFISGKEEGKTEDEISEELGSPAYLAKTLIEEHRRSFGARKEENCGDDFSEAGENTDKSRRSYVTDKEACHGERQIAMPWRRMCAYLIDSVIAVIPISVVSIIAGALLLPYLLFISYLSPGLGTLIGMSYRVYSTYNGYQEYTYSISDESVDFNSSTGTRDANGPVLSTYTYRIGPDGRQGDTWVITPAKARIISILTFAGLGFYVFYSLICTLVLKGQTIGKKIMRIKVQGSNTENITKMVVFCREFLGKTLINSIPLIALISFITILITPEHKALHDMLAGTVVTEAEG